MIWIIDQIFMSEYVYQHKYKGHEICDHKIFKDICDVTEKKSEKIW